MAAVVLAGPVLARLVPSVAQAESITAVRQIVRVPCSAAALSTALSAANVVPAALRLAAGCSYQITATLTVSGTVSLFGGPSTAIRPAAGFTGRLLDVSTTGRLRVQGISILDGNGNLDDEGVGIRNAGSLVLNFVTVSGNTANNGDGAGVANLEGARALIAHSFIGANNATGSEALGSGVGGGVLNRGSLTLFKSRLSANTAGENGGGLATDVTGTSRVVQSTIDHNFAAITGGGILNSGFTSLDRTLVVRNRAGTGGGGIQNSGTITARSDGRSACVDANGRGSPSECRTPDGARSSQGEERRVRDEHA
ncbi:MAG: hypothetical protein ACRDP6_37725 [Actinoallomurus sp.]